MNLERESHRPYPETERRRMPRQATVMRVATIHGPAGKELCLVRNISAAGLQARVYRHRRAGDVIDIEFKEGQVLRGTIVWARDYRIGVEFHGTANLEDLLTSRWSGEGLMTRPRPIRLEGNCPGILRAGSRLLGVRVRNVSQGGANVLVAEPVAERDAVLSLPGLPTLAGIIRWQSSEMAGMAFNEPLAVSVLARWIGDRQCVGEPLQPDPQPRAPRYALRGGTAS
jgi:hypothetical protein